MEKIENTRRPESMEKVSRIVLHFLRHGEKEKAKPGQSDNEVHLTPAGRQKAKLTAAETNVGQAMAFGSPRERSQESAALKMVGALDDITGDESFEELKAKLDEGIRYGSKVFEDKRLDFTLDETSPAGVKEMAAYTGKRWMPFLINESDKVAEECGDKEISTYSRMAGAVAGVVQKYETVASRWHDLVNDKGDHLYTDKLERFLGSHQGVTESFLAKVIEKTKGSAERDKFAAAVNNQGFDFMEGFEVEVVKAEAGQEPSIRVKFKKSDKDGKEIFSFDEEVPAEVIEEIIKEGEK